MFLNHGLNEDSDGKPIRTKLDEGSIKCESLHLETAVFTRDLNSSCISLMIVRGLIRAIERNNHSTLETNGT